jgi:hypothetical protein
MLEEGAMKIVWTTGHQPTQGEVMTTPDDEESARKLAEELWQEEADDE